MSVGVVAWPEYLKRRQSSPEECLHDTFELCQPVAERMRDAELVNEVRATGNFSYQSRAMTGQRFMLLGDAYAFVDPVFSSGVYLAMNSAELASETVDECMRNPARTRKALKHYDRTVRRGLKVMSWFIYRFTSPAMHALFMNPRNYFRVQEAVTSMLAGDVFGRAPINRPLAAFRLLYRLTQFGMFVDQIRNWHRRRRQVGIQFRGGTTSQDEI
jgi:flavin-dependent dehydrogenase